MPKLKTNRGATKRFRRSPNRIKCKHSHHNHILTKKVSKRKRHLRATISVHASRQHEVVRLLTGS